MTRTRQHTANFFKLAIAALPAIGTYYNIGDHRLAVAGSVLQIVLVLLGIGYIARITIPEAFALGYFSSFIDPVARAAEGTGHIRYTDGDGHAVDKSLKDSGARLLVVLPDDLDIGDTKVPSGLPAVLREIQKSCASASLVIANDEKPFGVYVEATARELLVVDVPNNLRGLSRYVMQEFRERPDLEKRAKKALNEYVGRLRSLSTEHRDQLRGRVTVLTAREFLAGKRA